MSGRRDGSGTLDASDVGAPGDQDAAGGGAPASREVPIVDPLRYEVRGEHARGGHGRVLEAWDRRLDRPVAIKELLRGSPQAAARFDREARLTAKLQHPGVVPIIEAARWPSGEPFYVMKMVSGRPFDELMAGTRSLDDRLALLPSVLAVADTLAYAHSQRIIHRDVKPANVLVGGFGETLLIDWGLGRDLAVDEPEPGTVGTPGYMPPEQAAGQPVDERADVYALGSLLYRLLAGLPPDATEPVGGEALERREPGIPVDLAAIVRTATAADPARRYPSARQLSEDLRRFLQGQLVGAHRYSRVQLLRRWARRHRAPLAVAAVLSTALAVTAIMSVRRIVREKQHAEAERARADERSNALTLSQAESWLDRDPTAAVAWLKRYPLDGAEPDRALALALEATSRGIARHVLAGHSDEVTGGGFTPDGARFVSASRDGTVRVWAVADGRLLSTRKRRGAVTLMRLSPDGKRVATVDSQGNLEIAAPDGEPAPLVGHHGAISALAVAADGRQLASGGYDNTVRWWDTETRQGRALVGHAGPVFEVAFSPDGAQLASASEDRTVRLWQRDGTGRIVGTQRTRVGQLAFHPQGARLASAALDGQVWLWDLARGGGRMVVTHDGAVNALAFSPDGRWLASAGRDRTVRVVELSTGRTRILRGATDDFYTVAFSPDSQMVVASGGDGVARVWDVERGEGTTLLGHRATVSGVAVSPDGKLVASFGRDRSVRLWPLTLHGRVLRGHDDTVFDVVFSPDGRRLASASRDQTVRIWDDHGTASVLRGHRGVVNRLRFSADGRRLLSASLDNTVRAWDLADGSSQPIVAEPMRFFDFAFLPGDAQLVGRGPEETLTVVDLRAHQRRFLRGPTLQVLGLALAPDGRTVAGASKDGSVWRWDLGSAEGRQLGRHDYAADAITWSPDGTLLASGGRDHTVRLWQTADGASRVLQGHTGSVSDLAFSPDGRRLASTGTENVIRVWDLATGHSRALTGHRESIRRIRFCGPWLVSASWDGTVRVWDVDTGASRIAHRHGGYVQSLAVSPDGRRIASGSMDATVWVGDVDEDPLLPMEPAALQKSLRQRTTAAIGRANELVSSAGEVR